MILIDGDWPVYRVGFAKDKDYIQQLEILDFYLNDVLANTCSEYRYFLTGKTNFRKEVATIQEYKANRKSAPKPRYYNEIREYLVDFWNAEISVDMEADDLCGIYQTDDTIIVGEDKDLLMIPGWHYRIKRKWNENCLIKISPEEAMGYFWKQMLIGDVGDNIPKIPQIGEVKATKYLSDKTNAEQRETVETLYKEHFKNDWYARFHEVATLLWIKRSLDTTYKDFI